jgi:gliding motility-associated lipoprotein GldH
MRNIFFLLATLLLLSCNDAIKYDKYKSIENDSWNKDSLVTFSFNQKDLTSKYNIYIKIRNNQDYPYSNLFLIVTMENPTDNNLVDTLEYAMANENGKLLGSGFSSVKESILIYKENFQFKNKGDHKIHIKHALRDLGKIEGKSKLEGVLDVGLQIEKIKNK